MRFCSAPSPTGNAWDQLTKPEQAAAEVLGAHSLAKPLRFYTAFKPAFRLLQHPTIHAERSNTSAGGICALCTALLTPPCAGWNQHSWDSGDKQPYSAAWSEETQDKQQAALSVLGLAPDLFAGYPSASDGHAKLKSAKLSQWAGHDGWMYKRGTGLVTFYYISPDGQECAHPTTFTRRCFDTCRHDCLDCCNCPDTLPSRRQRRHMKPIKQRMTQRRKTWSKERALSLEAQKQLQLQLPH